MEFAHSSHIFLNDLIDLIITIAWNANIILRFICYMKIVSRFCGGVAMFMLKKTISDREWTRWNRAKVKEKDTKAKTIYARTTNQRKKSINTPKNLDMAQRAKSGKHALTTK